MVIVMANVQSCSLTSAMSLDFFCKKKLKKNKKLLDFDLNPQEKGNKNTAFEVKEVSRKSLAVKPSLISLLLWQSRLRIAFACACLCIWVLLRMMLDHCRASPYSISIQRKACPQRDEWVKRAEESPWETTADLQRLVEEPMMWAGQILWDPGEVLLAPVLLLPLLHRGVTLFFLVVQCSVFLSGHPWVLPLAPLLFPFS